MTEAIKARSRALLAATEQGQRDRELRGRPAQQMRRRRAATVPEAEAVFAEVMSERLLDGATRTHARL